MLASTLVSSSSSAYQKADYLSLVDFNLLISNSGRGSCVCFVGRTTSSPSLDAFWHYFHFLVVFQFFNLFGLIYFVAEQFVFFFLYNYKKDVFFT